MQFHLNGFEPGDPEISDPAQRHAASGSSGTVPQEVDVLSHNAYRRRTPVRRSRPKLCTTARDDQADVSSPLVLPAQIPLEPVSAA